MVSEHDLRSIEITEGLATAVLPCGSYYHHSLLSLIKVDPHGNLYVPVVESMTRDWKNNEGKFVKLGAYHYVQVSKLDNLVANSHASPLGWGNLYGIRGMSDLDLAFASEHMADCKTISSSKPQSWSDTWVDMPHGGKLRAHKFESYEDYMKIFKRLENPSLVTNNVTYMYMYSGGPFFGNTRIESMLVGMSRIALWPMSYLDKFMDVARNGSVFTPTVIEDIEVRNEELIVQERFGTKVVSSVKLKIPSGKYKMLSFWSSARGFANEVFFLK